MTTCNDCETVAHCLKHGCIPKVRSTIDMAREAGVYEDWRLLLDDWRYGMKTEEDALKAFEALVRADERNRTWTQEHWTEYERSIAAVEREACAKVCDELIAPALYGDADKSMWDVTCMDCAAAIRARWQA